LKRTKKKKPASHTRVLLIAIIVVVLALGIYSLYTSSTPPATSTSSSTGLSSNDFVIKSISEVCGTNTLTGRIGIRVQGNLETLQGTAFHFVSATIIVLNFTLSNGTVVLVNEHLTDNKTTFDSKHLISFLFVLPRLPPDISVTQVEFTIIALVEEVPVPITATVGLPIRQC
jgi:hypothetical protein